jgi:hypothetical protein
MSVDNNMELLAENSEMHTTVTRNSSNLHLLSPNLTVFQKGSQYFRVKVYNSPPSNIKQLYKSKNQFKKALLQFFHLHAFYNMNEFYKFRENFFVNNFIWININIM